MKFECGDTAFDAQRVFCIGRNYAAHAEELGNDVPDSPVVFLKPALCLLSEGDAIILPTHGEDLQHEAELVVLIGKAGRPKSPGEAMEFLEGVTLGLDLTLRDVQSELKMAGLPWEKAKAFEGSAPIGSFVPFDRGIDLGAVQFSCHVNDQLRQSGDTALLLFPIDELLVHLGRIWLLRPGDVIYTGTPAGVGPLRSCDTIRVSSDTIGSFSWQVT